MLMVVGAVFMVMREFDRFTRISIRQLYTRQFVINSLIVAGVFVISAFNWSIHMDRADGLMDAFPVFTLLPLCILAGVFLRPSDAKWLIHFIAIESVVSLIEYGMGVPSIVPGVELPEIDPEQADLWYYRRVFGLSINSSVLALKVFTALLLMDYFRMKSMWFKFYRLLFFAAIFVTFNRTVILTVGIYFIGQQIQSWYVIKAPPRQQMAKMFGLLMVLVAAAIGVYYFSDELLAQFTRKKGVDLSGRDHIWPFFWDYILNDIMFGNGGMKVFDPMGRHAHNSFLQNWASHGGIVTFMLVWLILRNIRFKNFWLIAAILIYSSTQYGIFWGISLLDIAMYAFLFREVYLELLEDNKGDQSIRPPTVSQWT